MITDILYEPGILNIIYDYVGEFTEQKKYDRVMEELKRDVVELGFGLFSGPGILINDYEIYADYIHFNYPHIHIMKKKDYNVIYYSRYILNHITLYGTTYVNFNYSRMVYKLEVLSNKKTKIRNTKKVCSLYHVFDPNFGQHRIDICTFKQTKTTIYKYMINFIKDKLSQLF